MRRLLLLLLLAGPLAPAWGDEPPPPPAKSDEEAPSEDPSAPTSEAEEAEEELPQWGRGPFEVADPYVLSFYRARPWATSPEVLPHLGFSASARTVWANSYAFQTDRFAVDAETRALFFTARLGLFDRFQVGLQLDYQWRGGGILDGFIRDFHEAFGLPDADRPLRPRNRYLVTGVQADGQSFTLDHDGYGFGDLVLEGRGQLLKGESELLPALTATLRLRLPTGRRKFDMSDGVDWTLGLDASKRLPGLPLIAYAGLAYTYHDEARLDGGLELERHRVFFYVGGEWEITETISLVIHSWIESKRETILWRDRAGLPITDMVVGNWISYVAGGVKWEPKPGLTFELGAMENLVDPETTADLSLMFNLTWEH